MDCPNQSFRTVWFETSFFSKRTDLKLLKSPMAKNVKNIEKFYL